MAKLERLNARVSRLLTEAVDEVLEMVKQTVSEYQERTLRTQRENDSLKRRLQELKDLSARDGTAIVSLNSVQTEEQEDKRSQEQDLGPISKLPLTEQQLISSLKPNYGVKRMVKEQESFSDSESQAGCSSAQTAEHWQAQAMEGTPVVLGAAYSLHAANRDIVTAPSASHSRTSTGENLVVVKTEAEPTDIATSEPPGPQDNYSGCDELSSNSSLYNSSELPQTSREPYRLILVHSNHVGQRRHTHAKINRAALDGTRVRTEHLRKDDSSYPCTTCGKTFIRPTDLRLHKRCHVREKRHGCLQCGRLFSHAGDLVKHKRVHTGEKPFHCNQCGRSFSRRENLKRHQKVHIGKMLQMQQMLREQQQEQQH